MDNKLSELSKPVAYSLRFRNMHTGEPDKNINANTTFSTLEKAKAYGLGTRYVTQDDGKIVSVRDPAQDPIVEPLYSQEYVSALTQRIAELEEEFAFIMGQNDGMEKELRDKDARIEHLEAKLATPVRLPLLYSPDPWMSPDPDGTWLDKEDVKKSIRTAGFTVEGDA